MLKRLILSLILICCFALSCKAFNAANPYWLALKPKVVSFLKNNIDPKLYSYKLIGPSKEMKTFLGNRPGLNIKFERFNLSSPSTRKSFVAVAYDESGKRLDSLAINFNLWVYTKVYKLKKAVSQGDEILADNVHETSIAIAPSDTRLYFKGTVAQKVASQNIAAGVPLKIMMVRHEKLVQSGDAIRVSSGNKFITLEFMCKAINSGDVGDVININCPDMQQRTMKAKIIDSGHGRLI